MTLGKMLIHLFIPHHTNNHRAKALQTDAFLIYAAILLALNLGLRVVHRQMPDVLGYATDIRIEQLLISTNAQRASHNLPPLQLNNRLSQAAAGKAADMFSNNYWAHISPSKKTPWDFIVGAGYKYSVAGENLAKNFSTSDAVVSAWMNSQSHRDNILKSNYREIGFAVVNGVLGGEETTLVVQMFGTPVVQAVVAPKPIVLAQQTAVEVAVENNRVNPIPSPAVVKVNQELAFVKQKPLIDLPTLTKSLTVLFLGPLIALLLVDAWFIARRRTIRLSGHTFAHMLFLSMLMITLTRTLQGSII